jgi:prophage regulatory protein
MNATTQPSSLHLAHSQKPVIPRDRLIRLPEVLHLTGMGKSSVYDLMKSGKFPKNIRFNARMSVWKEADVLTWIQQVAGVSQ